MAAPAATSATGLETLEVSATHRLADVEAAWRSLEAGGIESPGQSFDFISLWVEELELDPADQLFVVARLDQRPIVLLPLHRSTRAGVRIFGWFPGEHVGCGAPLIDATRFATLSSRQRLELWETMLAAVAGGDVVHLRNVPENAYGLARPFAELGRTLATETLYRASFAGWDEANRIQRSKSRRKHDRQQGERLEALGAVSFEEIEGSDPAAVPILAELFRQRARRFEVMGVADPFTDCHVAAFYAATVGPQASVKVKLHVLRLDDAVVATRYSIAHGGRLFCLISSMSDDVRIQVGSPGKQCLLRVMQTVFDAGWQSFDMGNGFTDEKRHWCNEQIPLSSHYVALTRVGRLAAGADIAWRSIRARVKANPTLLAWAKSTRLKLRRGTELASPSGAEGE